MAAAARRTRIAVAAAFATQGLGFAVLLTHLPAFKDRYDVGDGVVTAVIFGVALLAGAGTALADRVSRSHGSGTALRLSLATIGVAVLVIGLSPTLLPFVVGFAVYGIGVGGVDASMNMQAVALQHRYGRSILTSFHAAWSAGGILGALYTSGTEKLELSLPLVLTVAAAAILVVSGSIGERVAASTSGIVNESDGENGGPAWRDPLASPGTAPWRPILLLGLAVVCFYVADSGTSSWSSDFLHEVLGASKSVAPLAFAGYTGSSLVSRLVGDHAVRRFGGPAIVRVGGVLGAAGLLLVVVAQQPLLAITGFAVLGLGIGVIAPLSFAAAGELSPGNADTVVAQVNVFNYVGFIAGGVVVGLFGSAGVLRGGFVVPLVLTLVIVALAPVFHPGHRSAALELER
ncbi:MAG: MFS transporter [Actinomycetales bacterium]